MSDRITITLSPEEGLVAAIQGAMQMMRAIQRGMVGRDHGGVSGRDLRERWAQAIHGQMAEHAWAKLRNVYPIASAAGIRTPDPGGCAIRATPWTTGCLIVNQSELPAYNDTPFVLICGHWPEFVAIGWLYGREARRDEWWRPRERPPSWWVPQEALRPIEMGQK